MGIGRTGHASTQTYGSRPPKPPSQGAAACSNEFRAHSRRGDGRRRSNRSGTPRCIVRIREGKPAVKSFLATPMTTRHNALAQLARCLNVTGSGCCSHHIAWTALAEIVSKELASECLEQVFFSNWQCSLCFSLRERDLDVPDDDEGEEQLCTICGMFVMPMAPQSTCETSTSSNDGTLLDISSSLPLARQKRDEAFRGHFNVVTCPPELRNTSC
eukprot:3600328-Amphidinium_carterae.1